MNPSYLKKFQLAIKLYYEATDLSFCAYLLATAEIAAVSGSAFGIDNHFRISFATADDLLKEAIKRIQNVV